MNSKVAFQCVAIVSSVLLCALALAEAPAEQAQIVKSADLNLESGVGVATLYQRIRRAADQVCRKPRGTLQLKLEPEINACKDDAIDRAILQANFPALTALHAARTETRTESGQYADRR